MPGAGGPALEITRLAPQQDTHTERYVIPDGTGEVLVTRRHRGVRSAVASVAQIWGWSYYAEENRDAARELAASDVGARRRG
jgi:hypothetical protein